MKIELTIAKDKNSLQGLFLRLKRSFYAGYPSPMTTAN